MSLSGNSSFEIPPAVNRHRLTSALRIACLLQPDSLPEWVRDPDWDTFAGSRHDLDAERLFAAYPRTGREELAAQAHGFVIATYWMDGLPHRNIPTREHVEHFFQQARLAEEAIVAPLAQACAEDMGNLLDGGQRQRLHEVETLATLENAITDIGPQPYFFGDNPHVGPSPITHAHVGTAVGSLIAELGEQLAAEGHIPFDWEYLDGVRAQFEAQ